MKRHTSPMLAIGTVLALAIPGVVLGSSAAYADPISQTSGFYVNPNSSPAVWAAANAGDSRASAIKNKIAQTPMATWFGSWTSDIASAVSNYVGAAATARKVPLLVAYNLPGRDACGGHSGGGAGSVSAYDAWIATFAKAIGSRPAIVILEPDSLGDFNCMSQAQINERAGMLSRAANTFKTSTPNTWAYIDAGNPGWVDAQTMIQRLNTAGIANAHGFSLNVSNFFTTGENTNYGNTVASGLKSRYGITKPYVIDTSRNGNGSNGQWCNPAGRKIGTPTQMGGGAEMLLWLKTPGESDGNCGVGGGSTAGQFLPDVAYKMIDGRQ